ncbi:MAG: hypothetical protein VXW22_09500, partial [Pseudomonadota bacterium]|nr:hypothetical protein [Pseudomonadota bacterium]
MMTLPRIRQLVFASYDHDDIAQLKRVLGLGEGFVDPGVQTFGLTNGVFALGDQFLEVVVPTEDNTAAGRFIDRTQGMGGYMAIFQTPDLNGVRERADARQIRRVWNTDRDDISASHLHPADIGAAIVSIDEARPEGSWLWGGPDWAANSQPGAITQLDVTAIDGLRAIENKGDHYLIGATATWTDLIRADLPDWFRAMKLAAREVG